MTNEGNHNHSCTQTLITKKTNTYNVFLEAALEQIVDARVVVGEANIDQALAGGAAVRAEILLDAYRFPSARSTLIRSGDKPDEGLPLREVQTHLPSRQRRASAAGAAHWSAVALPCRAPPS